MSRRVKEMREKGKETVKAAERRNRRSGKVRVRQMSARVIREFVRVFLCVCVCVVGLKRKKNCLFFVLVSLHNSTPGSVCVHLHRMI